MGDITLVSYVREAEEGPKPTCFGEVRDKVGISPIFLHLLPDQETTRTVRASSGSPVHRGLWGPAHPCLYLPLNCPVIGASQEPCSASGKDRCLRGPSSFWLGSPKQAARKGHLFSSLSPA